MSTTGAGRKKVNYVPKGWPAASGIEYIDRPRYASGVSAAVVRFLRGSTATAPTAAGGAVVQIRRISDPKHPAHGQHGLFATRRIPPNTFVLDYIGEVHTDTREESDYDLSLVRVRTTDVDPTATEDDIWVSVGVDAARCGNEARFVNDYRGVAERPNVVFKDNRAGSGGKGELRMSIWSGPRGVEKGSELLVSYGKGFWAARSSSLSAHARAHGTPDALEIEAESKDVTDVLRPHWQPGSEPAPASARPQQMQRVRKDRRCP